MPFTGRSVSDCAYRDQSTVIGSGRETSPKRIGGFTQRDAVALHPAVLGEGEAVELLAEVLDHVVALGLAVHQHVEAERPPACAITSAISRLA